jgi:hypothetical protein
VGRVNTLNARRSSSDNTIWHALDRGIAMFCHSNHPAWLQRHGSNPAAP